MKHPIPKSGLDLCVDCEHERSYHNHAGCRIDQCGCQEFTRTARSVSVLSLEEARLVSLEDLREDIIRSAARGQGPTFIAAKLDILIAKATFTGILPEAT